MICKEGAAVEYKVGDKVWLDGKDLHTDRPSRKLADKRYGPFCQDPSYTPGTGIDIADSRWEFSHVADFAETVGRDVGRSAKSRIDPATLLPLCHSS